jgi:hypothetical protein
MSLVNHVTGSTFDESQLVAYYKLANTNDSGPNGYNLTNIVAPTYVAGLYGGNCANYAAASSEGQLRDTTTFITDSDNYTISLWLNLTSTPANSVQYFIMETQQNTHGMQIYFVYRQDSGIVRWYWDRYFYGIGQSRVGYTETLSLNTWYHMCVTYDGTNNYGYKNGSLKQTAGKVTGSNNNYTNRLTIGCIQETLYPGGYTDGKIQELIVTKKCWSAQEVYMYYQGMKDIINATSNY